MDIHNKRGFIGDSESFKCSNSELEEDPAC